MESWNTWRMLIVFRGFLCGEGGILVDGDLQLYTGFSFGFPLKLYMLDSS